MDSADLYPNAAHHGAWQDVSRYRDCEFEAPDPESTTPRQPPSSRRFGSDARDDDGSRRRRDSPVLDSRSLCFVRLCMDLPRAVDLDHRGRAVERPRAGRISRAGGRGDRRADLASWRFSPHDDEYLAYRKPRGTHGQDRPEAYDSISCAIFLMCTTSIIHIGLMNGPRMQRRVRRAILAPRDFARRPRGGRRRGRDAFDLSLREPHDSSPIPGVGALREDRWPGRAPGRLDVGSVPGCVAFPRADVCRRTDRM